ncbi:lipopolysaccharide biosynthesis protein [Rubrobacter taiwanensis]|nr:oligosaccharide flippase family protein [Rubrobacter taiwanensis]
MRNQLKGILPRGQFTRGVAVLAGSTVLAQGLILLASPLLTRFYTPAEFGIFAIYVAILLPLVTMASWRYELAIPLPEDEDIAANLLVVSLVLVVGMSLLSAVGVWMLGEQIARWFNAATLKPYLWLVPAGLLGAGAYQALSYWAVRKKEFGPLARTKLTQSLGQVLPQIGLGLLKLGPLGLLVGDTIGRALGGGFLAILFWRDGARGAIRLRSMFDCLRNYSVYPKIMLWASLLNIVALQSPFLLLPRYFDVAVAGLYLLAYRVMVLPASLFGSAVGQVFFGRAAEDRRNPERLRLISVRVAIALFAINLPIYIGVTLAGKDVFSLVFGEQWSLAGTFAQVLAPMTLMWSVASPLSGLLIVANRELESFGFTALELAVRVSAILIGVYLNSIMVAVILISLSGFILSLAAIVRFLRAANVSAKELIMPVTRLILINLPSVLILVLALQAEKPWVTLIALMGTVLLSYTATLKYFPELRFTLLGRDSKPW